ncbi:MAG TPA: hypothetical protein VF660_04920 [Actinomycetota bacterium]
MRAAAAVLALVLLCGCSGTTRGRNRTNAAAPSGTAGEEEGKAALNKIPAQDRLAFVQIGVAAGNLRSSAALIRIQNKVPESDTTTFRALARNVASLHPRDPLLQRLRRWTARELKRAIEARRSLRAARRSVATTLAGVDRITEGLRAYVFVHPEIGALVPD